MILTAFSHLEAPKSSRCVINVVIMYAKTIHAVTRSKQRIRFLVLPIWRLVRKLFLPAEPAHQSSRVTGPSETRNAHMLPARYQTVT